MNKQSNQSLTLIIKLLFISVLLVLLVSNFALFLYSYEDFVVMVLSRYGKISKIEKFKDLFPPERFIFLKYILLTITIIYGYVLFAFRNKIYKLSDSIIELKEEFKILFKSILKEIYTLTLFQKVLFALVIVSTFIFRIYFIFKFPFNIDEVFSYMFFVDEGLMVAATYYPGPNNHIFFSELCVFADIFLNNPVMVMRLPSLIAGIVVSFLFFILLKKYFNFYVAIIATIIFSFSFNIIYYSMHGRGYILLILFVLASTFSMLKILEKGKTQRSYCIIYTFSTILGFYTIPVFLYPHLSLSVYAVIIILSETDWKLFKKLIEVNLLAGFFVFLLYFPVLLLNGINSVTGNKWVEPLSLNLFWSSLSKYLFNAGNYFWNVNSYGEIISILVISGAVFIFMKNRNKKWAALIICIFIIPFFTISIQKVQPFFRVWDYMIIFFSIGLAVMLDSLLSLIDNERIKKALIILLFSVVLFFAVKDYNEYAKTGSAYYNQLNGFIDKIIKEKPTSVYVADDTYNIFLRYKFLKTGIPIDLTVVNDRKQYDFIIIPKEFAFPSDIERKKYLFYYSNSHIHSYKLKK